MLGYLQDPATIRHQDPTPAGLIVQHEVTKTNEIITAGETIPNGSSKMIERRKNSEEKDAESGQDIVARRLVSPSVPSCTSDL